MKKSKLKKEQKRLSIMLVPHSPDKTKIYSITTMYGRLKALFILILIFFIGFACVASYFIYKNQKLEADIAWLRGRTVDQDKLIIEKMEEIQELNEKESALTERVDEFKTKYKEMTENYLEVPKTSRSGDRNEKTFLADVNKLKGILDNLERVSKSDDQDLTDLAETENKLKSYMETVPTLWPAKGRISDNYGYRIHPILRTKIFHEGLDIAAGYGEDVAAAGSGEVVFAGWFSGYGYAIIIDHGHGITTVYGHTSKILVKKGLSVNKGDVIAKVGSSGSSTGPHLHFEVRVNDSPVDPLKYLDKQ